MTWNKTLGEIIKRGDPEEAQNPKTWPLKDLIIQREKHDKTWPKGWFQ